MHIATGVALNPSNLVLVLGNDDVCRICFALGTVSLYIGTDFVDLVFKGLPILEVPVSYTGRTHAEGKKISWFDFVSAVWTLVRLRVSS